MNLIRRIFRSIYRILDTEELARAMAEQPRDDEYINEWIFRTTVFPYQTPNNKENQDA